MSDVTNIRSDLFVRDFSGKTAATLHNLLCSPLYHHFKRYLMVLRMLCFLDMSVGIAATVA